MCAVAKPQPPSNMSDLMAVLWNVEGIVSPYCLETLVIMRSSHKNLES